MFQKIEVKTEKGYKRTLKYYNFKPYFHFSSLLLLESNPFWPIKVSHFIFRRTAPGASPHVRDWGLYCVELWPS